MSLKNGVLNIYLMLMILIFVIAYNNSRWVRINEVKIIFYCCRGK